VCKYRVDILIHSTQDIVVIISKEKERVGIIGGGVGICLCKNCIDCFDIVL